jgi:hypothetical protein
VLLQTHSGPKLYRLRAAVTHDSYGDEVQDWKNPSRKLLPKARVEDAETVEEDGVVRRVLKGERVLFVYGTPDITSEDRIEIAGQVWRVNGLPNQRRGLASGAYLTATLTRNSG